MKRLSTIALLAFGLAFTLAAPARAQVGPASIIVQPIGDKSIVDRQKYIGNVRSPKRAIVGSAVDGRVIEIPVEEGDYVQVEWSDPDDPQAAPNAQPLAQLLTNTLQIEIDAADALLQLRKEEQQELVAGPRPGEIAEMRAKLDGAQSRLQYAKLRRDRMRKLFASGSIVSQEQVDEAEAAYDAAAAELAAATEAYKLIEEGTREEQLRQAAVKVKMQEEEIRRLEDRKNKYTIRTRIDGYVTAKHTEVGEWITQGDPIAEVVQLDPIVIIVNVPEAMVTVISERMAVDEQAGGGAKVNITVPSLPPDSIPVDKETGKRELRGEIVGVIPVADQQTRTFPVKVGLRNPRYGAGHLLKAGMLAEVTFELRSKQVKLVSKDALVFNRLQRTVWIYTPGAGDKLGTVRPVPVETGLADGSLIEVIGKVEPGQLVVVEGNERLRPGQEAKVLETRPALLQKQPNPNRQKDDEG